MIRVRSHRTSENAAAALTSVVGLQLAAVDGVKRVGAAMLSLVTPTPLYAQDKDEETTHWWDVVTEALETLGAWGAAIIAATTGGVGALVCVLLGGAHYYIDSIVRLLQFLEWSEINKPDPDINAPTPDDIQRFCVYWWNEGHNYAMNNGVDATRFDDMCSRTSGASIITEQPVDNPSLPWP